MNRVYVVFYKTKTKKQFQLTVNTKSIRLYGEAEIGSIRNRFEWVEISIGRTWPTTKSQKSHKLLKIWRKRNCKIKFVSNSLKAVSWANHEHVPHDIAPQNVLRWDCLQSCESRDNINIDETSGLKPDCWTEPWSCASWQSSVEHTALRPVAIPKVEN